MTRAANVKAPVYGNWAVGLIFLVLMMAVAAVPWAVVWAVLLLRG